MYHQKNKITNKKLLVILICLMCFLGTTLLIKPQTAHATGSTPQEITNKILTAIIALFVMNGSIFLNQKVAEEASKKVYEQAKTEGYEPEIVNDSIYFNKYVIEKYNNKFDSIYGTTFTTGNVMPVEASSAITWLASRGYTTNVYYVTTITAKGSYFNHNDYLYAIPPEQLFKEPAYVYYGDNAVRPNKYVAYLHRRSNDSTFQTYAVFNCKAGIDYSQDSLAFPRTTPGEIIDVFVRTTEKLAKPLTDAAMSQQYRIDAGTINSIPSPLDTSRGVTIEPTLDSSGNIPNVVNITDPTPIAPTIVVNTDAQEQIEAIDRVGQKLDINFPNILTALTNIYNKIVDIFTNSNFIKTIDTTLTNLANSISTIPEKVTSIATRLPEIITSIENLPDRILQKIGPNTPTNPDPNAPPMKIESEFEHRDNPDPKKYRIWDLLRLLLVILFLILRVLLAGLLAIITLRSIPPNSTLLNENMVKGFDFFKNISGGPLGTTVMVAINATAVFLMSIAAYKVLKKKFHSFT